MFNDRDLGVLGAGALLSVLCLLLPLPFAGKVALGFGVLVGFMVLAFLRLGPDRIPPEEWLRRRLRYHLQARRYTYQQESTVRPRRKQELGRRPWWGHWRKAGPGSAQPALAAAHPLPIPLGRILPIAIAVDEIQVYPLVSLLLGVVGVYLLAWLGQGGAEELSSLIERILR
jgi:hypothetical protein